MLAFLGDCANIRSKSKDTVPRQSMACSAYSASLSFVLGVELLESARVRTLKRLLVPFAPAFVPVAALALGPGIRDGVSPDMVAAGRALVAEEGRVDGRMDERGVEDSRFLPWAFLATALPFFTREKILRPGFPVLFPDLFLTLETPTAGEARSAP